MALLGNHQPHRDGISGDGFLVLAVEQPRNVGVLFDGAAFPQAGEARPRGGSELFQASVAARAVACRVRGSAMAG